MGSKLSFCNLMYYVQSNLHHLDIHPSCIRGKLQVYGGNIYSTLPPVIISISISISISGAINHALYPRLQGFHLLDSNVNSTPMCL